MTITEPARHRLYEKLEGVLGTDEAATLMAHLPPVGWADVATKADLQQLHDRIHVDLADLRLDLRSEMEAFRTEIRGEMEAFRTEIRGEMEAFRTEIRGEIDAFRTEIRKDLSDFRDELRRDRIAAQRQMLFVFLAAAISVLVTLVTQL